MPFKSEAQRRKFGELVKEGKLSKETFEEWNSNTPKKLPEHVEKQPKSQAVNSKVRTIKQSKVIK